MPLCHWTIKESSKNYRKYPDDDYNNVPTEFRDRINRLPDSLSVFKADASCKLSVSYNINTDYIRLYTLLPDLDYTKALTYFNNPIRGVWNGIPWVAANTEDEEGDTPAYVNYNNQVYDAKYVSNDSQSIPDVEKDDCTLYNEAAKDQILAAIQAAYPTL